MLDVDKASPAERTGPTGPRTEAGKRRTRLNAYKHGLTGQIQLFTAEEREAFKKHCQSIVEALAPVGTLESELAQAIAEDRWRINRAHALESSIFALGQLEQLADSPNGLQLHQAFSQARTWLAEGGNLHLLSLYEQRIQRSIHKNMADLRVLRAERLAARQQALEEAILLSQLAKSKGEICNPAAAFPSCEFVFSNDEIDHLISRRQRLDEARALVQSRIHPNPALQMAAAA